VNDTILKFGYPDTVVAEYWHWVVLLRQKQLTAGSLILACKEDVDAFWKVSVEAFHELKKVTADLERSLAPVVRFEKINYVMLMMVDPHVHFHVLPRHGGEREVAGVTFRDAGWPKVPDFAATNEMTEEAFADLRRTLAAAWRKSP
jgi:diadenosine tetraphosphate (Ap4A) HIT family hydrolase